MPDIWYDVDTALAEVPVNKVPLIDDTDFKSIEAAVAYNATGLALYWHFVTTAGAYSVTAVTPTTGGNYDWTDQGDAGVYTIEIPASGGASINNDTEGFGWFTGKATGVLPWCSPIYGFRAAGLNNLLIDDAYSTTRGLSGTALPAAAADAAGGLAISDEGGLDLDAIKTQTDKLGDANYGIDKLVRSTTPANTLDVSATGEAGLDFSNIKDATGAHTLTNITVPTVTTLTGHTAQTGDSYAIVNGDHGLVSIQDDVDAIKTKTDTIPTWPSNFEHLSITDTTGLVDITQAAADKVWSTTARVLTANTNLANIEVDLTKIHGSAITETAGQLAAGFTKFFDVATPVLTCESVNQAQDNATTAEIVTALEANGTKLDHLWEMTEDDGGTRRLTANALETAPSGGLNAGQVAAAVWDAVAASYDDASSMGALLNDAGAGASAETIANAVWDEVLHTDHEVSGSASVLLQAASAPSAADVADAVWDEAIADHTTATTFGGKNQKVVPSETINDYKATGFSTHSAADVWSVATRVLTANTNLSIPAVADIADAVWDEASTGHTDAGKAGQQLWTDLDAVLADTGELQTNQGNWLTATGFATPTNITAGTITTVTNLTNLPSIPNNWITANGITDGAITNAKVADDVDVNVKTITAGAITATAIADAAIDNATFAADVGSTAYATNIIALAAKKALDEYDPPTNTEFELRTLAAADYTVVTDLGTVQTGDSYAIVNGDHGLVSIQDDVDAILAGTVTNAAGADVAADIIAVKAVVDLIEDINRNKMEITDANGNVVLRADNNSDALYSVAGGVTDNLTTTIRKRLE